MTVTNWLTIALAVLVPTIGGVLLMWRTVAVLSNRLSDVQTQGAKIDSLITTTGVINSEMARVGAKMDAHLQASEERHASNERRIDEHANRLERLERIYMEKRVT